MGKDCICAIVDSLNNLLANLGELPVCKGDIVFVCEDAIIYGSQKTVHYNNLIPMERSQEFMASMLEGGPEWLHANLMRTNDGSPLVTIRTGMKLDYPVPFINVSYEKEGVVHVVT
jgi:hypothetical protein